MPPVQASNISKANTVLQLSAVSLALVGAAYGNLGALDPVIPWVHYATGATTVATLADYIRRPGISTASSRSADR